MAERFDFSYWPPLAHELPPVRPAESAPSEEICYRLAYIGDDERFRAVHASGEWADIEDFWLESDPPLPQNMRSERIGPITSQRTLLKRHLSDSTYTFHRVALQLADQHLTDTEESYDWAQDFANSDIYRFLQGCFYGKDPARRRERLLISRVALSAFLEEPEAPPQGLGEKGMLIIGRVVTRWSATMMHFEIW